MFKGLQRAISSTLAYCKDLAVYFFSRPLITWRKVGIVVSVGLVCTGLFLLWAATLELPDLTGVNDRKVVQSTKIYDRTGQVLLYDLSQNITRTTVPIDTISPFIKDATVALEDKDFYTHQGIQPLSIVRAILANITSLSFSQGGSTITQQVIKNSLLTQDKTPTRKLKEWVLAVKLEQVFSKKQILEIYLNESPYGGSIYGVEEASRAFFGKSSHDLTLGEAVYLAALPQAPTYYSPYGNHRADLDRRKNLALDRMRELRLITAGQYDAALKEEVSFFPPRETKIKAPHFVFYVQEILEEKYGARALESGGYRIITTLDADMQAKGEETVKKYALENTKKYNASNASLVAIDPKNGEILAMVGSRDYFDTEIPGNFNIALASRQPGSAFKPFVYATAFNRGFTPETIVFDLRTQFSTNCRPEETDNAEDPCYSPQNYDNVFRGPVTLRGALAQSLNIPSVKVLYLAGINNSLQLAKSMGITTLTDVSRYGLTLVLGGGEVRLLDMVSAYGGFATNGYHYAPSAILRVEDAGGSVLERAEPSAARVLPENTASLINDVLSDNEARAPAFGAESALNFPGRDVAVKTGTTNDYRDAWIVGYTPNIVVGAWAGNNDNSPMEKRVAGFIVAPLWNEFMNEVLPNRPQESFIRAERDTSGLPPPLRGVWQGGQSELIDTRTGASATLSTPQEFLGERVGGGVHDILYWIDKNNPTGPKPANPAADPQFNFWEYPVRAWAASHGYTDSSTVVVPYLGGLAEDVSDTPGPAGPAVASFSITYPKSGSSLPAHAPITTSIHSGSQIVQVRYYFNGLHIGASTASPFSITLVPSALFGRVNENNTLRAVASLSDGSDVVAETTFTLTP